MPAPTTHLQFKQDVARAVVSDDNAALASMDTGAVLDLLHTPIAAAAQPHTGTGTGSAAAAAGFGAVAGAGADLAAGDDGGGWSKGLPPLWGPEQYEQDLDLDGFLQHL